MEAMVGLLMLVALTTVESTENQTHDALQLIVHLNSYKFALRSEIRCGIEVTNNGSEPIAFWDHFLWGLGGTLDFEVRTADGKTVPNRLMIDDPALEEFLLNPEVKARQPRLLEPGQSVQTEKWFSTDMIVHEPGGYVLLITYEAPELPADEAKSEHPIWTRDSGTLVGSAEFEVVETRK